MEGGRAEGGGAAMEPPGVRGCGKPYVASVGSEECVRVCDEVWGLVEVARAEAVPPPAPRRAYSSDMAPADEERHASAEARRDTVLLGLLPALEESLRQLRPRLAELRAQQAQADSAREAFTLLSEALDEFERTLGLVRETRTALNRVELRLTRRFDQLLRRLREVEQGL